MFAVNYTNLRDNMKTYMDKVTDKTSYLCVENRYIMC